MPGANQATGTQHSSYSNGYKLNHSAMPMQEKNITSANGVLSPDGDVWWDGVTKTASQALIDWTGQPWTPDCGNKAAHGNARYAPPASQCPQICPQSGFRRGFTSLPFSWRSLPDPDAIGDGRFQPEPCVFIASITGSPLTAAAQGTVGAVAVLHCHAAKLWLQYGRSTMP